MPQNEKQETIPNSQKPRISWGKPQILPSLRFSPASNNTSTSN